MRVYVYCIRVNVSEIWNEVFKNGRSKICGRQPLQNLKRYGLLKHNNYYKVKIETNWFCKRFITPFGWLRIFISKEVF